MRRLLLNVRLALANWRMTFRRPNLPQRPSRLRLPPPRQYAHDESSYARTTITLLAIVALVAVAGAWLLTRPGPVVPPAERADIQPRPSATATHTVTVAPTVTPAASPARRHRRVRRVSRPHRRHRTRPAHRRAAAVYAPRAASTRPPPSPAPVVQATAVAPAATAAPVRTVVPVATARPTRPVRTAPHIVTGGTIGPDPAPSGGGAIGPDPAPNEKGPR